MEQEITHYSRGKLRVGRVTVRESARYYQYILDKFHFLKSPKTFRVIIYNNGLLEKLLSIIIKLRKDYLPEI
jgi:hypothetical protein